MPRESTEARLPDTEEPATSAQCRSARWERNAFNEANVADLTTQLISRMSRHELVKVVQLAEVPFLRKETLQRLEYLDSETLKRLAFLARRCCRQRSCCRDTSMEVEL